MAEQPSSILFLIRSLNLGGAERQLILLATGLKTRGHDVTVAVYYEGELDGELRSSGVRLLRLEKRGRWDLAGFSWRLISAIRAIRPDILYSFLGTSNILAAAVRPFVPRLKLVWSVRASFMDFSAYDRVSALVYRIECALSRQADLIISNSNAGAAYAVSHGFPADRIKVVPNGIDTDRFHPDAAARQSLRTEWGVATHDTLIGVLARFDPMKDYPTFLRAAALAASERQETRFACVGSGSEARTEELKALAASLGLASRMIWPGQLPNPVGALNAFDICCSSSTGEGFSNSIAEAMACDVPCVVTDVGDSAHIVGSTGLVVPPGDDQALGQALTALIDKLKSGEELGPRGRILSCFSIERMILSTEEALIGDLHHAARDRDPPAPRISSQKSA